ncbi:flagellar protein FliT [Halalkalibacter hemicellulosilyticus]|uniref:Flagellar protein FliT n=1 Tax=Halalkalibacter hemicellulosilyticusJCM 9152 TaxID=1236971 RepID=W4QHH5_9BACI|nr:flagellar protein FliT [Halalkalibacter hemicellulosilyticus]GAE31555.1 flagellar protein [Halalkalibacter hemicellulosilyticusJCM 9152]
MSVIKKNHEESQTLLTFLKTDLPEDPDKRDQFISELETKLDVREALIKQIDRPPVTDDEKELAKEIIMMNEEISELLASKNREIQRDIEQTKRKKQTGRKYDNPYDGPTSEGIFFDKRGV